MMEVTLPRLCKLIHPNSQLTMWTHFKQRVDIVNKILLMYYFSVSCKTTSLAPEKKALFN